jgi:hypothetical protein
MTERLLVLLRVRANRHGLVLARSERLQALLRCSPGALSHALTALATTGKVEILAPQPYLVLALLPRFWSGRSPSRTRKPQQISSDSSPSQEEVPVSSNAAAAATATEDGGAGEGGALLAEVLTVLGPEARREEFAALLAGRSPALIRRCLKRVAATRQIRVSRSALFRSLLDKLSA